ncbi:hypothetical protein LCGC14_0824200, partial [marine sediment metagenome]
MAIIPLAKGTLDTSCGLYQYGGDLDSMRFRKEDALSFSEDEWNKCLEHKVKRIEFINHEDGTLYYVSMDDAIKGGYFSDEGAGNLRRVPMSMWTHAALSESWNPKLILVDTRRAAPATKASSRRGRKGGVLANPDCKDCPLHETARNVCVPADGPTDAEIMFLGRNPGEDEDKANKPFVGRAGQLLRNAIGASDLEESELYITNVVKCHTPDNRKPTKEELAACDKYLQAELRKVKPKYIFVFGNEALGQLTGKEHGSKSKKNGAPGIMSLQGMTMKVADYIVFPMAHPSFIVRQGGVEDNKGGQRARASYLATFNANVQKLRQMQSEEETADAAEPEVKLCLTAAAVSRALADLET